MRRVEGTYGAGAVSGSYFNPAVAFGIDVSRAHVGFGVCVYTHFELIGAIIATVFFGWSVMMRKVHNQGWRVRDGRYPLGSKLVSEFIGTYMLELIVGLNVLGSPTAGPFSLPLL